MKKETVVVHEKELLEKCKRKDVEAQKILFETYGPRLLAICARYCTQMEDARDAMQDGFVKIFTDIHKFKGQSSLYTWMSRIMMNTAIDLFKKNIRFDLKEESSFADEAIEEKPLPRLSMPVLVKCLQTLPDGYRVVFNMYAIEGFTHKEIAQQLGISEGTSKSQLARARKFLQELIKEKQLLER